MEQFPGGNFPGGGDFSGWQFSGGCLFPGGNFLGGIFPGGFFPTGIFPDTHGKIKQLYVLKTLKLYYSSDKTLNKYAIYNIKAKHIYY